jgi:hypothetical protein
MSGRPEHFSVLGLVLGVIQTAALDQRHIGIHHLLDQILQNKTINKMNKKQLF